MLNSYLFGYETTSPAGRPDIGATGSFSSGGKDSDVRYLEGRVDRLSLICMAMWSLLRDKTDLSERDLMDRVKFLDLLDGQEDGKATRTVAKCAACDRPMNPRHKKCLYCGHAKLIESAFDAM